jgi:hypothetical protein
MAKLTYFLNTSGTFEVHRAGCADVTRAIRAGASGYGKNPKMGMDDSGAFPLEADSPKEAVLELWDDQISESWALDEDPEATLLTGTHNEDGTFSDDATWEPSTTWLTEHLYLAQSETHFFPCIKNWVSHSTANCTGAGQDWVGDPQTTKAVAVECPGCRQTAAQLGAVPKKSRGKWSPKSVPAHDVETDTLTFISGSKAAADDGMTKAAAKRELATRLALAAAAMVDSMATDGSDLQWLLAFAETTDPHKAKAAAKECIAQWLHGMPVDRERFLTVLPRPDRSDWRKDAA